MRAIFGVVSLLVVLAVVGLIATRQLRATGPAGGAALPVEAGASAATVGEQAQQLPRRVQADVVKALEQGAAATREAADK